MAIVQKPTGGRFERALILANRNASRFAEQGERVLRHLEARLMLETRDGDEPGLPRFLRENESSYDVIFVAGGDGTINGLLATLVELSTPVGVIPLGTANDFAKALAIPADPIEAVDALLAGEPHDVDVGLVNDLHFINVASIGLGADVAREMATTEKGLFGILSYPLALIRAYRSARPIRVRMWLDGELRRLRVLQLGVGNGHSHGGGIYVSETVSITDGLFDIYCVIPPSFWRLTFILHALMRAEHAREPSVMTFTASKIELRSSRKVDVNIDGELATTTPASFRVKRSALTILAPLDWKGS
ncbi:MAG: YegS/Rv2252/BmrU family lipid kinase [Alphaproteobacteria bacterium]|nr:YegS/Rv2252/BmrU family lipid kinase [Alphaproteobacteria bacterium]